MMKTLRALLLLACSVLPLRAVDAGDTLDQVLAEKGPPSSRLERGAILMLTYPDAVIRLKEGKVIAVKAVDPDSKVNTVPAPTATTAARPAAQLPTIMAGEWTSQYQAALASAKATNKKVFVLFTGSDWCIWCQRLEKEILSQPAFVDYARQNLVLVKLDFLRNTPVPAERMAEYQQLAQDYGVQGFPTIIVLNSKGKSIGSLGYMPGGPQPFLAKLGGL